ncbi:hypothetical protein M231_03242 [Tremella mesenterica]|uniref:Uncharacterized protein n=1 Tax=Tremella mesenterica TaxID=5217 RepID=A0A4Q1BP77_TREME|nr:hypothetical protein M231_03242 [Tremella mesenterica]
MTKPSPSTLRSHPTAEPPSPSRERGKCKCCKQKPYGSYGTVPYGGRVGLVLGALWEISDSREQTSPPDSPSKTTPKVEYPTSPDPRRNRMEVTQPPMEMTNLTSPQRAKVAVHPTNGYACR